MEDSPKVNAVIEFNTKAARESPTPKAIKYLYRSIMILSTVWAVIIEPIFTNIPTHTAYEIDKILVASITALYQICFRFGWVVEGNRKTEV